MRTTFESVVLDSEGLAAWIRKDRTVMPLLGELIEMGADLVVSANTIIEVSHAKLDRPRLEWLLSRVSTEAVAKQAAREAAALLVDARMHGHSHAIDATVAVAALQRTGPTAIVTSDGDDMRALCGRSVTIIPV